MNLKKIMSKITAIYFSFAFLILKASLFSQIKGEVIVTGTVYISSSVSPGVMNGNSISEGPFAFRKQPIYFKNDSILIKTATDSIGFFSIKLKEGSYTVLQEEGLTSSKGKLTQFGSEFIEVKRNGGPYKIVLKNSSNRRSSMNSGTPNNNSSGLKSTKTNKNTLEK